MKNVYPLLLIFLLGLSALTTIAQPICGFDGYHQKMMALDPVFRKSVEANNITLQNYIQQHPQLLRRRTGNKIVTGGNPQSLSSPLLIPIVVHVINTGGEIGTTYNPSDAQILGAIDYLNQVYAGTWPTISTSVNSAGNLGIQFVLAQRDPNCNPTNGINRIDGSGVSGYVAGGINRTTTLGTNEINIKNLSRWDNTQYYNVWVVNKIDGNDGTSGQFIAGYAQFPGFAPSTDGIVMLATQMVSGQKTLPHEIGHAFNLYHPFQGSTLKGSCPAVTAGGCSVDGDQVCDTPPIDENVSAGGVVDFTCRTGQTNSCNSNQVFTDATEENYMNYTNCFTLFTPGQSARMQASANTSRSSLTTSLGGTPPGAGCTPKVDFELQGDHETEATTATTSCRNYKDYSYNMVIGVGASATTTATLVVNNGTAVQGIDFDVTTNSNFASPSQQLTFAANSTTSQPFTIRVYDDASVNGTRSASLSFTLNNGGGNAIIGDGRPTFSLTIDDNDRAPYGPGTVAAIMGSDQVTLKSPLQGTHTVNRTQMLYYASELTAQGIKTGYNITGLSLDIDKQSSIPFQGLTIKLATTNQSSLYTAGTEVPLSEASFTTVYSNSYSTVNGWNNFTFSTPFAWNGTSNIVVELCYGNSSADALDDNAEGYIDGSNKTNYVFYPVACGTNYSTISFYTGGIKPYIKLNYFDPGTQVQTALNTSQSQDLAPNADIYFYDQTNGQLMARIQNLSSFNYGCTQVSIDRAGTSATQFWNSNTTNYLMDKTFHVTPTTNNASGSYNITLYYTQAEIQGWQTATGQTLSAIQLVKVPGQILSVTPSNPSAAGTATVVNPTISTIGTNTGLTYNFTNGFSGFGAGVPSFTALPINLIDFTGILENNSAVLSWSTAQEQNSAGFEVTRSFDGQHFSKIGYVAAAGNSTTQRNYTFTDPALTSDSNFYQLKQISLDGNSTYSKIVLVRDPSRNPAYTVLPNPFSTELDIIFGHLPTGKADIRLLDLTGRTLWRQTTIQSEGTRLHLDLSGIRLVPGIYLLELTSATGTTTQRLLKK